MVIALAEPICTPFPDISRRIIKSVAVWRKLANRRALDIHFHPDFFLEISPATNWPHNCRSAANRLPMSISCPSTLRGWHIPIRLPSAVASSPMWHGRRHHSKKPGLRVRRVLPLILAHPDASSQYRRLLTIRLSLH